MAKRAQLLDVDDTPISPVTSADTVYIDEDTTVGEKIDAINENLTKYTTWHLLGSASGTNQVDISSIVNTCNEIYVSISYQSFRFNQIIIPSELSSTENTIRGGYDTGDGHGGFALQISNTYAYVGYFKLGSTDYASSCTIKIFYK